MHTADTVTPQKPEWRQQTYKDVVRDNHRLSESLPFSIVHYPGTYGTWILFQESEGSPPFLCACQRDAAIGFLRINEQNPTYRLAQGQSLVDFFIPSNLRSSSSLCASSIKEFAELPLFQSGLCHICNHRVPSIRWSNLDEHSIFVQHFGWYFHHALFRAGISPFGDVLHGEIDSEIAALFEIDPAKGYRRIHELLASQGSGIAVLERAPSQLESCYPGRTEARSIYQTLKRQTQKIHRLIEERLRHSLGFPRHGKTGGSEILLRWIISALFPGREVLSRHRPEFLSGLELDIFLPELRLAIEYQGEQHYEAFKHLGGERHLQNVLKRDKRKAVLCKQHGVDLKYFNIADKLTEAHVRERLYTYTNSPTS